MSEEITKVQESSEVLLFKEQLKIAEEYANAIRNSMYGKKFEKLIPDTENDLDADGNPTKNKIVIENNDIVACILMGRSLGLSDMVSVSFGRALDNLSYFQVMKGKALGLDTTSSLQHIFAYEKEGKVITGIDGQGINAIILKAGITYKYLNDFKRKVYYRDQKKVFLGYEFDPNWVIMNRGIKPEDFKLALSEGKYAVLEDFTFFTEIEFYRKGWDNHIESYSLLDATEAGLYKGIDFAGNEVKGKVAWNGNPKRVLMTRVISIGGSRIGGDALNGLVSLDELNEIKNYDNAPVDTSYEDMTTKQ